MTPKEPGGWVKNPEWKRGMDKFSMKWDPKTKSFKSTGPNIPRYILKKPSKEMVWDPGAGLKSGLARSGMRSIARGGGALGIAGLLALDPFDAGEEEVTSTTRNPEKNIPIPNSNLADTPAIRADRSKRLTQAEEDLKALMEYRSGAGFDDFQDRANQAFMDRQGYATGGIIGLQNGGGYPGAQGYADPESPEDIINRKRYEDIIARSGKRPEAIYGTGRRPAWKPAHGEEPSRYIQQLLEGDPDYRTQYEADRDAGLARQALALPREHQSAAEELGMGLGEYGEYAGLSGDYFGDLLQSKEDEKEKIWDIYHRESDPIPTGMGGASTGQEVEGIPAPLPGGGVPEDQDSEQMRLLKAQALWGRTQTPAEKARDDYWDARRQREQDNSFALLASGVAEAISGSGGVRGNIGKGLAKATREQIAHGRLISDYEGLPITEAAARSRYHTYEQQNQVLTDIADRLASRDEMDVQVAGRIEEMRMQLAQAGQMTPQGLGIMEEILREAVLNKKMSLEEKAELMDQLSRMVAGRAGYRPVESE
jgi:hypothetical protein